ERGLLEQLGGVGELPPPDAPVQAEQAVDVPAGELPAGAGHAAPSAAAAPARPPPRRRPAAPPPGRPARSAAGRSRRSSSLTPPAGRWRSCRTAWRAGSQRAACATWHTRRPRLTETTS